MKRIRPAPMGRAFRYQRRLTHIILSVAEREAAGGLVTKVEEPAVGPKAGKAKVEELKAAPKATKAKAEEPKAAPKATKKKAEEPQAAPKATKKKAGTKA
jgi:large subunit ribosomal protein L22